MKLQGVLLMKSSYSLNSIPIKRPTTFTIARFNITKATRLASGLMSMEIIATKRKFTFSYDAINADELQTILDILFGGTAFYTLEYVENNTTKTVTVYSGATNQDLWRTGDKWIWHKVKFSLIEQ